MKDASSFKASPFLMTPDQIRARAAVQKASPDPEVQKLGRLGEALARAIEKRQGTMPDLKTLQTKLADARQEVQNLTVLGMSPHLTADKAATVRQLELSARSEVKARTMALQYGQSPEAQKAAQPAATVQPIPQTVPMPSSRNQNPT